MRRSREDTAETRRRIIEIASRLFRARGIAEVSVADVMTAADMTVGGFYRHFASKDDLVAEAIAASSRKGVAIDSYLSMAHRDHPEHGCPVAALCSEVAHEGASTKKAFTAAIDRMLDAISESVPGESRRARDRRMQIAASLVGALTLARATNDKKLAESILAAVRRQLRAP